jgi:hypothetical protein
MAHRVIRDPSGVQWDVWDVRPEVVSRHVRSRLRDLPDGGWLAFESVGERRQLSPIPADWEQVSDDELGRLLARARPRAPRRRLAR